MGRVINPCNCEHKDHFDFRVSRDGVVDRPRGLHEHMAVEAGSQWAMWIGHVCDYCAATCMVDYIEPHTCTSKYCCLEWLENGTCIHSDHTL